MQLIVLGMHRSGTSVLARLLNMMGAYFGPEGISTGANKENPKGFWERRDVRDINDFILTSVGCDWNKIANFELETIPEKTIEEFNSQASKIILEIDANRPWFLKEPRFCLSFPMWRRLLEVPVCIHIFRNPVEVAKSINKRNGIPVDVGIAMWEIYNISALRASKDLPRILVSHRKLMQDPIPVVEDLFSQLSSYGVDGLRIPSPKEITSFVDVELYREREDKGDLDQYLNVSQKEFFKLFEDGRIFTKDSSLFLSKGGRSSLERYEFNLQKQEEAKAAHESACKVESELRGQLEQKEKELVGQLSQKEKEVLVAKEAAGKIESELKGQLEQKEKELLEQLSQKSREVLVVKEAAGRIESELRSQLERKEKELVEQLSQKSREVLVVKEAAGRIESELRSQLERKEKELVEQLSLKDKEVLVAREAAGKSESEFRSQLEQEEMELGRLLQQKDKEVLVAKEAVGKIESELILLKEKYAKVASEAVGKVELELRIQLEQKEIALISARNDVDKFDSLLSQLIYVTDALICTYRWKIGNAIVSLKNRVFFMPSPMLAIEHISKITNRYNKLKAERAVVDANYSENGSVFVIDKFADDINVVKREWRDIEVPSRQMKSQLVKESKILVNEEVKANGKLKGFLQKNCDIIICVHNAPDDVTECIESVIRHTNLKHNNIVLIDDGSDRKTSEIVIGYAARLAAKYTRNEQAKGYTIAANQGLRLSTEEYVVLLNSDTIVTPGWLEKLINCAILNPKASIVGPLSNAASWQSIPYLTDENGGWCTNTLPKDISLETYSENISNNSSRLYPKTTLINGFCYLMTREVLNKIGLLDEETFPTGYGEEDDFSIRAMNSGYVLYIADDCYVYHKKSQSFTAERRKTIVSTSKNKIFNKHGKNKIKELVKAVQFSEDLVKSRTVAQLLHEDLAQIKKTEKKAGRVNLKICWLQPHLKSVGGIRRAIEMTNRLISYGHEVTLLTLDGVKSDWLPIAAKVVKVSEYNNHVADVLIVSDPDMFGYFEKIKAPLRINYHLAAYMLYREKTKYLEKYYVGSKGLVNVANSKWTAEQLEDYNGISCQKIIPGGINRAQFHPISSENAFDVVCYGSKRVHKGTDFIYDATNGLKVLNLANANLEQDELSRYISKGKVFVSGCKHEGFNFCPLEAMACGIPVVMTDDGGSREYAENEVNSLVLKNRDTKSMRTAINRLLSDNALRIKLIENGIRTAWKYNWDYITKDFNDLIVENYLNYKGH